MADGGAVPAERASADALAHLKRRLRLVCTHASAATWLPITDTSPKLQALLASVGATESAYYGIAVMTGLFDRASLQFAEHETSSSELWASFEGRSEGRYPWATPRGPDRAVRVGLRRPIDELIE